MSGTIVSVELGKSSVRLPVFVIDFEEDCLLGTDFLSAVNLENIFEPMFGRNIQGKEGGIACSRIQNFVKRIPPFLKELFERESRDLEERQRDLFAQFLDEFQDVFSFERIKEGRGQERDEGLRDGRGNVRRGGKGM